MSAKAVPVVVNTGGHKEIINHGKDGLLWNTEAGLLKSTEVLVQNSKVMHQMASLAQEKSQKFDYEKFKKSLLSLL